MAQISTDHVATPSQKVIAIDLGVNTVLKCKIDFSIGDKKLMF